MQECDRWPILATKHLICCLIKKVETLHLFIPFPWTVGKELLALVSCKILEGNTIIWFSVHEDILLNTKNNSLPLWNACYVPALL